mmetsp:Transcript_5219/g.15269  ORF Transcript_5219/g.15269 Transcript_5219/m.15269 type:complete len:284 (+) Transcript_5219:1-852(+)
MDVNEPLTTLMKAMPVRFSAFHLCFDNPALNVLLSTILLAMPKDLRIRHRSHFGSHMEVQYDITANYGIPEALVPIDQSGNVKRTTFHRWLDRLLEEESIAHALATSMPPPRRPRSMPQRNAGAARDERNRDAAGDEGRDRSARHQRNGDGPSAGHAAESGTITPSSGSTSSASLQQDDIIEEYIEVPRLQDVLLGRGRPYREYPGNATLRDIVQDVQSEYDRVSKTQKTFLATSILNQVQANGGRFLSRADDENLGWVSVNDEVARTKVAQSFRNNRIGRES